MTFTARESAQLSIRQRWHLLRRVSVCAVGRVSAGVLVVLIALGGATPAGASGLSIGGGSTVKLGDALLKLGCNDLLIQSTGTLQAQSSTIRIGGNWDNKGTFDAGTGTVVFEDGCIPNQSNITGSSTFFDLQLMTSTGKTVDFEAVRPRRCSMGSRCRAPRATCWSSAAA